MIENASSLRLIYQRMNRLPATSLATIHDIFILTSLIAVTNGDAANMIEAAWCLL